MSKIGLGGSCHWCTEAIFESLHGVTRLEQGWLSSEAPQNALSEGVIVHFDPNQIPLAMLIEIHLFTHSCTSNHSMRDKYRSAIYAFNHQQLTESSQALANLQSQFNKPLVTRALAFSQFTPSPEKYQHYYSTDPHRPFCTNIIDPKLAILRRRYRALVKRKN